MKLIKILVLLLVIFAVIYLSLSLFIATKGKDLLKQKLQEYTDQEVFVDSLSVSFPLTVKVKGLSTLGLKVKELDASLSVLKLISGRVGLSALKVSGADIELIRKGNKISAPFFVYPDSLTQPLRSSFKSKPQVNLSFSNIPSLGLENIAYADQPGNQEAVNFFLRYLKLEDINIKFKDKTQGYSFECALGNLTLQAYNLRYPLGGRISFSLSSDLSIGSILLEDNLELSGWIDFPAKSMDVILQVKKIPYNSFSVYYPESWKPDRVGLERATFSLKSFFEAKDNNLTISGMLGLIKYKFKTEEEDSTKVAIAKAIINMFKRGKDYPEFDFKLRTKFDDPRLDLTMIKAQAKSNMKGVTITIGKELLKDAVGVVPKTVNISKEATEQAIDVAKDALSEVLKSPDRAEDIMKDAGKILKSIFVIEEEE